MFRSCYLTAALCACVLLPATARSKENFQKPAPVHLDKDGEKWARATLKKMSLEQKVGQMFMIWAKAEFLNVSSPQYRLLVDQLHKYHLGGFGLTVRYVDGLLYKNEPLEAAMVTNQLQREAEFPLIFAADFERGLGMRLNEVTSFPHAMAFGATGKVDYARQSGQITAQEARAIGVQWNWFPDVDVNSNPLNPIINTRSFGEDPQLVAEMANAYIKGAHEFGMLTTAKHFPGHGDTAVDSHLSVPQVSSVRAHLESTELAPFRSAVQAGVDAVMVAHVVVPALDSNPHHVATISQQIVGQVLKKDLGFKGLVVTDALDMNGLLQLYPQRGAQAAAAAAVDAVKAGNDVLLLPSDLDGAYNGLLQAVRSGEIPESQIDESVLKILRAKASVGLNKARLVDIAAITDLVARPENLRAAQDIADSSVTLVRDNGQVLPLRARPQGTNLPGNTYQTAGDGKGSTLLLILTEDSRSDSGRILEQQVRQRMAGVQVMNIDWASAAAWTQIAFEAAQRAANIIAAVYEVPSAGRPLDEVRLSAGEGMPIEGPQSALLRAVLRSAGAKTIVVAMGNPYIAANFPEIQTYLCTYSNSSVSETSAVKAIFGEIPINGRLPVSIPNVASRGAGISTPAQRASGGAK
jgi:beta-N-acetylhexosaminidase